MKYCNMAIVALGFLLCFASSLFADSCDIIDNTRLSSAEILNILHELNWIPDGKNNSRVVYIIAAPWCPVSKALYDKTRLLTGDIQFRWVMVGANDNNSSLINRSLSFTRDQKKLNSLFTTGSVPQINDNTAVEADKINILGFDVIKLSLDKLYGKTTGYPTLVFYNGSGISVFSGIPSNLNTVLEKAKHFPAENDNYIDSLNGAKSIPLHHETFIVKKPEVVVHIRPSINSFNLAVLKQNLKIIPNAMIQLKNNSRWIYIQVFSNGLGGWSQLEGFSN